jgi:hypothetical protein
MNQYRGPARTCEWRYFIPVHAPRTMVPMTRADRSAGRTPDRGPYVRRRPFTCNTSTTHPFHVDPNADDPSARCTSDRYGHPRINALRVRTCVRLNAGDVCGPPGRTRDGRNHTARSARTPAGAHRRDAHTISMSQSPAY